MISLDDNARQAASDPDVQLMLRAADDDRAFQELVDLYEARVCALIARLVKPSDLAPDLTQEVFLRVYRSRHCYTPTGRFSAWLFTIARNVASNFRQTLRRRREVGCDTWYGSRMSWPAPIASSPTPLQHLESREAVMMVHVAIDALNERQRTAVRLAGLESMSYADVADAMDLTVKAVKSLLSRARTNLRLRLKPYDEHGYRPVDVG